MGDATNDLLELLAAALFERDNSMISWHESRVAQQEEYRKIAKEHINAALAEHEHKLMEGNQ